MLFRVKKEGSVSAVFFFFKCWKTSRRRKVKMSRYLKKKERNIFLGNSSKNVTFTAIHYVTGRDAGRQALPSASTLLPLYRFFLKYDYRAVSPHWFLTLTNIWARSVAFASQ